MPTAPQDFDDDDNFRKTDRGSKVSGANNSEANGEVTVFDIENGNFKMGHIKYMFFILFVSNIGNSLDHGAIPVLTPILREDLNLNTQ